MKSTLLTIAGLTLIAASAFAGSPPDFDLVNEKIAEMQKEKYECNHYRSTKMPERSLLACSSQGKSDKIFRVTWEDLAPGSRCDSQKATKIEEI